MDLKFVSKYLCLYHFHMESLRTITDPLQTREFLTSLDLMEAYQHIPIHQAHRKFLHFCVRRLYLQFKALHFGLATAPHVFTKVMVNPIAFLTEKGIHVHPYLDTLLIHSSSEEQAHKNTELFINCLRDHGFLLNL